MRQLLVFIVLAAAVAIGPGAPTATAQTSAHFKLQESTINAGGNPADGVILSSTHFRVKLDSIGESEQALGLSSSSFRMDGGFVADYPPAGEVAHLRFTSRTNLSWDSERSTGTYNLYRGLVSSLSGLDFGTCYQQGVTGNQASEAATPPAGSSWFYLVTARNRLGEEGSKGSMSSGTERPNPSPCP